MIYLMECLSEIQEEHSTRYIPVDPHTWYIIQYDALQVVVHHMKCCTNGCDASCDVINSYSMMLHSVWCIMWCYTSWCVACDAVMYHIWCIMSCDGFITWCIIPCDAWCKQMNFTMWCIMWYEASCNMIHLVLWCIVWCDALYEAMHNAMWCIMWSCGSCDVLHYVAGCIRLCEASCDVMQCMKWCDVSCGIMYHNTVCILQFDAP